LISGPSIAAPPQLKKSFFAADYQKKVAALVGEDGEVLWKMKIGSIHDAQHLKSGGWLMQTSFKNVIELDANGVETWRYEVQSTDEQKVEIHAFRRLGNGLTMIAESGPGRIIEVDREKKIVHEIPLKLERRDAHRDTRLVRPTPQGTYLVAHEGDLTIREYQRDGTVIWEHPLGMKVYSATRLENGNTLVGTGDGHSVLEISPEHKTVWSIQENELPGVQLAWVTMVERLPSGNTWIVNCHAGKENPQVLEVTADKKIVGSFTNFDFFGNSLPVAVPAGIMEP
jgi:hypothetical protein